MYKKGQWVANLSRAGQPMRVQRDQKMNDPIVWCEWMDGGYHLEAHGHSELEAMPESDWPAEL